VLLAVGPVEKELVEHWGLKPSAKGIHIDSASFRTSRDGVFAVGAALRPLKFAVRSVAAGKVVAACIDQYLNRTEIVAPDIGFNTKVGKLSAEQLQDFLMRVSSAERSEPVGGLVEGFTTAEARAEAERCLHCECSAVDDCLLRRFSDLYSADAKRFKGEYGRAIRLHTGHPEIFFEPGKCIACGLCVQIANAAGEELGLAFIGRGFQVRVDVPLGGDLAEGLKKAAEACADACPTGALDYFRKLDGSETAGKSKRKNQD
jgi:ferredoxin